MNIGETEKIHHIEEPAKVPDEIPADWPGVAQPVPEEQPV